MQAQISLCAKIGYMYYCEYAHLLKKCTEYTCMSVIHDDQSSQIKADNIPFNQLYYIAENCADRYYSKVIKTFVFLIKRQIADRQTLLVNTACSLKFLEEYANRQAQIWKVLQKYHNLPDEVEDLHFHFDSFKSTIETDFRHLKKRGNVPERTEHSDISQYTTNLFLHPMYSR